MDSLGLATRLQEHLDHGMERLTAVACFGRVVRAVGLLVEVEGLPAATGDLARLDSTTGEILAEVVGFDGERTYLMPLQPTAGIEVGTRVAVSGPPQLPELHSMLGRIVDGLGRAMDTGGELPSAYRTPVPRVINPMTRPAISEQLDTGIRSINALISVGRGQRLGLFAGSGVGKSVLLRMMTRFTAADVIVVGLIGERGREVRESSF